MSPTSVDGVAPVDLRLDPHSRGSAPRAGLVLAHSDAAELIPSDATLVVGGSGSLLQVPETLLSAIETRWHESATPTGLTVVHVMGLGDHEGRGVDHLAFAGLVKRFVGSHFVLSPREQNAIMNGDVEAIGLPAGTISLLYREIAARRPGLFTDIGIDTFVDPRHQWGRMNDRTLTGLSAVMTIGGEEVLFYPRFDVDVALIRATASDADGNLTMDDEAAFSDNLAIAQAARNSGGLVIAEVKRVEGQDAFPAARIRIPANLIDHVVITDHPVQTPVTLHDSRRSGLHVNEPTFVPALALGHRKVIARRAAQEVSIGDVANLGVGVANGISYVALEEGVLNEFTLTIEQGVNGGLPGVGLDSGTAINPSSIVDMSSQFDFYDGGGLDFAGLAFAEVDRAGNVNVALAGGKPIGPGGFIDISQKARTVVFCGTLRGGGLLTSIDADGLVIHSEGRYPKFVEKVEYVAFNARRALARRQRVVYVTERAVFHLTPEGIELIEYAPGTDIERDVIAQMGFRPRVSPELRTMDPRLFGSGRFGLQLRSRQPIRRTQGAMNHD